MKSIIRALLSLWMGSCLHHSVIAQEKPYLGAEIRTKETFLYGKFEVRMKSSEASGVIYAFFTFYDEADFADHWNEVDIEILGRYTNEVQFNSITGKHLMNEKRQALVFNPHDAFHLYSFCWTPDYISWSVDGTEVYRQTGERIKAMNRPQKIMMNIWPSASREWAGTFDEIKLPLKAEYDFVNYYRYQPGSKDTFQLNWSDTFDRYDTDRWQAASHTFDGNNCVFDPQNIKVQGGYLILLLTKPEDEETEAIPLVIIKSAQLTENTSKKWKGLAAVRIDFYQPVHLSLIKTQNFKLPHGTIAHSWLSMERTYAILYVDGISPENLKYNHVSFEALSPEGKKYSETFVIR